MYDVVVEIDTIWSGQKKNKNQRSLSARNKTSVYNLKKAIYGEFKDTQQIV